MCALSEDSLAWEILNEYDIPPETDSLSELAARIAGDKLVTQSDIIAILKRHFGPEAWKNQ